MKEEFNTELFKAIKQVEAANLNESDKNDLLHVFNNTTNAAIRDQIALIFAKVRYNKAIFSIINKINDKALFNHTGTLVYSLQELDIKNYFIDLIKIMVEQAYESQIVAYTAIKNLIGFIDNNTSSQALMLLNRFKIEIEEVDNNSDTVDLINSVIDLLEASNTHL